MFSLLFIFLKEKMIYSSKFIMLYYWIFYTDKPNTYYITKDEVIVNEIKPVITLKVFHKLGNALFERTETGNNEIDRTPKLRNSPSNKSNIESNGGNDKNLAAFDPAEGKTKGNLENT